MLETPIQPLTSAYLQGTRTISAKVPLRYLSLMGEDPHPQQTNFSDELMKHIPKSRTVNQGLLKKHQQGLFEAEVHLTSFLMVICKPQHTWQASKKSLSKSP